MWRLRVFTVVAPLAVLGCADPPDEPQNFEIDGRVGLAALASLSDGHLEKIAKDFQLLALRDEVRSANWTVIQEPLAAVAAGNIPALVWFALPDGSYWSVQGGKASGNLSDRAYWPRLMGGEIVLGHLVASKATGKASAIVAVPVRDGSNSIVGVLGSSVYITELSLLLKGQLDLQPNLIFFSIDATPIGALQDDPEQIFLDPFALDEPELETAIREMLMNDEGVVNYRFRGKRRTVLYRRSVVSGWWYAFGRVWD